MSAINLLVQKNTLEALKQAEQLEPLVTSALALFGRMDSGDYWDIASMIELACLRGDWSMATEALWKALATETEAWMLWATYLNLCTLRKVQIKVGTNNAELDNIISHLESGRENKACLEQRSAEDFQIRASKE